MTCRFINGALVNLGNNKLSKKEEKILSEFVGLLREEADKDKDRKHGKKSFCRCEKCKDGKRIRDLDRDIRGSKKRRVQHTHG